MRDRSSDMHRGAFATNRCAARKAGSTRPTTTCGCRSAWLCASDSVPSANIVCGIPLPSAPLKWRRVSQAMENKPSGVNIRGQKLPNAIARRNNACAASASWANPRPQYRHRPRRPKEPDVPANAQMRERDGSAGKRLSRGRLQGSALCDSQNVANSVLHHVAAQQCMTKESSVVKGSGQHIKHQLNI